MGHILGLSHNLADLGGQLIGGLDIFRGGSFVPPSFAPPGVSRAALPIVGPLIDGGNMGVTVNPTNQQLIECSGCGGGKKQYFTVTVNEDGSQCVRERKSRKRRRRLATASDIKDLSSLKTILGNGTAFKQWIATRG